MRATWSRGFRALALALVAVTAGAGLAAVQPPTRAEALSGSEFNPGQIISDALFYDGAAMTSAEIQAFLDQKIGTCLTDRCLNVAVLPVASRAASYGRSGDLICGPIAGGQLRASELIYRTQVACSISAKVILVTLQKEQSLVTSRAPSDWALRAAMGMGCPDTAPCSEAFAGLANQIMSGTAQLKTYKAGPFARQPGTHFIQFHPNGACGGTSVDIVNYATAALYNYTPYQPNGAALANLGGTGDGCSSYGNRNFWVYYNNWFGPSTGVACQENPTREIFTYWEGLGGDASTLGAPVSPGIVPGPAGTTVGFYENGAVYCTPRVGPHGVTGEIATAYASAGGPSSSLGSPIGSAVALTAGGISGAMQEFQRGTMLSSAQTGTHAVLHGAIRQAWGDRGGSRGTLGWPTGPQQTLTGGVSQEFQNGTIIVLSGMPATVLSGAIGEYWMSGSNASALGLPQGAATALTAGGVTGQVQYFANGMVLSSTETGTHAVLNGPLRNAWGNKGGTGGELGWPTADRTTVNGSSVQEFQRGTIIVNGGTGAVLAGPIATYWQSGSTATTLGMPTASPTPWTAGGVSGTLQYFERGMVLSSTTTGTYAVLNGPIRDAWGARGGSGGSYGWPTGDQQSTNGQVSQQFQGGVLSTSTTPADPIAAYVATGSNSSKLGRPTAAATAWTAGGVSGRLQYFERGMVLSSTTTGTYAVLDGPLRTAWGNTGGTGGSYGWPTGDQQTSGGQISQTFQRGTLSAPAGASGATGPIEEYLATGSNSSKLGRATAAATPWTAGGVSGTLQYFERGMVLSSTTTGTFAVLNGPIRNAWGNTGGTGGSLGWPTADQESVSGGTSQQFQRGSILVRSSGEVVASSGAISDYLATGSNAATLGSPTSAVTPLTAGGVSGSLQYFQRGMVLSSTTTGTFAVRDGAFRNAWGNTGGAGGSLGWPTGDQQSVAGGIRQEFQRGSIIIPTGGSAVVLSGDIGAYWAAGSNATMLGAPVSSPQAVTAGGVTGLRQDFARGTVLSSTTTGTYAILSGLIRSSWEAAGGVSGTLGWPTGDQVVKAGGQQQPFQNGVIFVSSDGIAYPLSSDYYTYWSAGSNATLLGRPVERVTTWSAGGVTGSYQVFERGMVMSSSTTGTFAVLNGPIRVEWGALGGSGGSLGWPTGDAAPVAEGTRQQFQRGAVIVPPSGPAYVVMD